MRGCTQRVCSAQAVCSLAGPRSIKSVPGRFQVKRHSRDVAYQAFPLSACNIERWVWPGDEANVIAPSLDGRDQYSRSKSGDRQTDYCNPLAHAQRVNEGSYMC